MRRALGVWRRSLHTRVVVKTVALSVVIIGAVGWFLLATVASGLAENRRDSAIAEARTGFAQAQRQLEAAVDSGHEAQRDILVSLVDSLGATGDEHRSYELVLQGPLVADSPAPVRSSGAVGLADLPEDLVTQVSNAGGTRWRYAELSILPRDAEPAVVVGSRITAPTSGQHFGLYYVFSMSEQQQTLALVRGTLILGGLLLVALVAAVAWLVTRQVVDPLREARLVAQQFAAGDFEQRMHVTGEDDIAHLSLAFNQMAHSLQSQITRLENLSQLQQQFVSDVSHELRTPLTTVQMAAQLLEDSRHSFPRPAARAAELLSAELSRFEALLSDLMDLSRFDAGAATLELDAIDMAAVARRAARDDALVRARIQARAVGADLPVVVEADIRRVERILRNLVGNAIKYSGTSRLDIVLRHDADVVSMSIRDFGIGLDDEEKERIFDRFWRADPARSKGGTGLGLAIAREDAVLHGGTLDVWSRRGQGTEFIVTLPRRHGEVVVRPVIQSVFT